MASKRPVDITVLHASSVRRPRAPGSQPVAVVTIEGHDDRFITGPGFGEDPIWKARQIFYIEEELVSGDEPSDIRIELFDSPNLDCHMGSTLINLETAMDYYNKAHSYPVILEGKPQGSLTVAVSVAPRSLSPSAGIPCSSTPPLPLVGPPLPGEAVIYAPMPPPASQGQGQGQGQFGPQPGAYGRGSEPYAGASRGSLPNPNQSNPSQEYARAYSGQGGLGPAPQARGPPFTPQSSGMQGQPRGYRSGPYPGQAGQTSAGPGPEPRGSQGPSPGQNGQAGYPSSPGAYPGQGKQAPYPAPQSSQYPPQSFPPQTPSPQVGYPSQPPPGYLPARPGGSVHAGPYPPSGNRQAHADAMTTNRQGKGSRYDSGDGDMADGIVAGVFVAAATGLVVADVIDNDYDF